MTQTQVRHSLAHVGRSAIVGGLFVLLTLLGSPAAGAPALPDLLKALDLGSYRGGMKPPEFSGRTLEGRTVSLAGLRGRVVLLSFWATWCPPCREEMPVFERLHREFAGQGLAVLGINAGEGADAIRGYAKELGLNFPLVLDPKGQIGTLYGVIGLPTTFLIGRDGRAVGLAVGPREWGSAQARTIIETLLAEPAAPGRPR